MAQAPLENGSSFDRLSLSQDLLIAPKVDIGGNQVAEALMVALVAVAVGEGDLLPLESGYTGEHCLGFGPLLTVGDTPAV